MGAPKILFTDGEGPIVFKDLAYDLAPDKNLFELLSLYDDYLAESNRHGYQAGDTLSLVVPHFLYHGFTDEDVYWESKTAAVVPGVTEYIKGLQNDHWTIRIISTAYRPMWDIVGSKLNIPPSDIACTELNLAQLRKKYQSAKFDEATSAMENVLLPHLAISQEIMQRVGSGESIVAVFADYPNIIGALEQFYWKTLPSLGYQPLEVVRVVGGRRKVDEAKKFALELGISLSETAYDGDSITDKALFAELKRVGGLGIAVNGNRYALEEARVAVATTDMRSLRPVLDSWYRDGFDGVAKFIMDQQRSRSGKEYEVNLGKHAHYSLVDVGDEQNFEELIAIHKKYRHAVRGAAAALG